MAKLLEAELFCTREPHMASEEVFGSQKRKADVPLGFEGKSYRPDKVNGLRPGQVGLNMLIIIYPT
jgi:hypothetical protein